MCACVRERDSQGVLMDEQGHICNSALQQSKTLGTRTKPVSGSMVSDADEQKNTVNSLFEGCQHEATILRPGFVSQAQVQKHVFSAQQQLHNKMQLIALDWDVFIRWRCIGATQGLTSDTAVATYLINQVEECKSALQARGCCLGCKGVLPQHCFKCSHLLDTVNTTSLLHSGQLLTKVNINSVHEELAVEVNSIIYSKEHLSAGSLHGYRKVSRVDKAQLSGSSKILSAETKPQTVLMYPDQTRSKNVKDADRLEVFDYQQIKSCLKDKSEKIQEGSPRQTVKKNPNRSKKRKFTRKKEGFVPEKSLLVTADEKTINKDLGDNCSRKKSLVSGVSKERQRKTWICKECNTAFSNSTNLKDHARTHTGEKPFKCEHCPATFRCAGNLKSHNRKHTGERPFKCEICGKAFARNTTLRTHMRIHTNDRPYKCDVCDAAFRQQGLLVIHKRKHSGDKPFRCKLCATAFFSSGSLSAHMTSHTGLKPFLCDECGSAFTQKGILKAHMLTHTGERSFSCEQCGKAFHRKNGLQAHQRIHSGIKNLRCAVCGAAFHSPSNFRRHMRKHSGYKPHMCTKCGKHFASTSELKVHTRIHTGDKPYVCRDCGKGFITAGNMNKHWNNRHKPKPPHPFAFCQAQES